MKVICNRTRELVRYLILRYPSTNFARNTMARRFGDGAICCADTPRVWPHYGMRYSRTRLAKNSRLFYYFDTFNVKMAKLVRGYCLSSPFIRTASGAVFWRTNNKEKGQRLLPVGFGWLCLSKIG